MTETWIPLFGGLILLVAGGELLVRGAVQAAERLCISPLVIGLTLVGFGTSMPELVTSVQAGLNGSPGIAYGNVVGSNIANILLIAGVSALICPIIVARSALRRDATVMLAVAAGFAVLAWTVPLGRLAGLGLVALLIGYIAFVVRQERGPADGGALRDKTQALAQADPVGQERKQLARELAERAEQRSVRVNDLVAVLTQCVKSQAETIARHESEIGELKAALLEQRALVAGLKRD